jgi:hypothetical protein
MRIGAPLLAVWFSLAGGQRRAGQALTLHSPLTIGAAAKALVALLIEITFIVTFIVTFTQHFFAR